MLFDAFAGLPGVLAAMLVLFTSSLLYYSGDGAEGFESIPATMYLSILMLTGQGEPDGELTTLLKSLCGPEPKRPAALKDAALFRGLREERVETRGSPVRDAALRTTTNRMSALFPRTDDESGARSNARGCRASRSRRATRRSTWRVPSTSGSAATTVCCCCTPTRRPPG